MNNELEKDIQHSSGALWEIQVFGCAAMEFPIPEYKGWTTALKEVLSLENQRMLGWDPFAPHTQIGFRLYRAVQYRLEIHQRSNLGLYCAIGSTFDYWHGADGFFRLGNLIATIDLSTRCGKQNKSSFVFFRADRSEKKIQPVADKIARTLITTPSRGPDYIQCKNE